MDGWLTAKRAYYHDQYMKLAMQEGLEQQAAAQKAAYQTNWAMNKLQQNIFATTDRLETAKNAVNEFGTNLSNVATQLTDPNLSPQTQAELSSKLNYYQACYNSALIKQEAAS